MRRSSPCLERIGSGNRIPAKDDAARRQGCQSRDHSEANSKARVNVYNAAKALVEGYVPKRDRKKLPKECRDLLDNWIDTITGVAYRERSTEFKVIPACVQLADIPREHIGASLPVPFASFEGRILRSDDTYPDGTRKYNILLPKEKTITNDGWLAAFEGDLRLLREYAGIIYSETGNKTAMGFFVVQNPGEDQLRALVLYNLGYGSYANAIWNLSSNARFLQVAQRRTG